MATLSATQLGAIGDGATDDTIAIQRALDLIHSYGGGDLVIPKGDYLSGVLEVFSDTTIHLQDGARLLSSPDMNLHNYNGMPAGLLFAQDAENIRIEGGGTLDGNCGAFYIEGRLNAAPEGFEDGWDRFTAQRLAGLSYGSDDIRHGPVGKVLPRPGNMIVFARCKNVHVSGVSVTGAAYWTFHCADCEHVSFEDVSIENDPRHPNNDGIHLTTCRDAVICGCSITAGDDAIAITGFNDAKFEPEIALGLSGIESECSGIIVEDCDLSSRSSGVRIGYGLNPTRDIALRHLNIHRSNRGICIQARESDVSDILIEHCSIKTQLYAGYWWGCGEPINISSVRFPDSDKLFNVENVVIRDMSIESAQGIVVYGEVEGFIRNVFLDGVRITRVEDPLYELWGGNADFRPAHHTEHGLRQAEDYPIWSVNADLVCRNVY